MKQKKIVIEVACFTPTAAITAADSGAHRIELCSGYAEGGLSPSAATIMWATEKLHIPVHVMIRPRIGDFIYSEIEIEIILREAIFCKENHAAGIVVGALNNKGEIDSDFISRLVEAVYPLPVNFHRAFDLCPNQTEALEALIRCGVSRILTSGGAPDCITGIRRIENLIKLAAGRIIILPGGGIRPDNIHKIIAVDGITEVHLSGKKIANSPMQPHPAVSFTSINEVNDYQWYECDPEAIKAVKNALID